MSTTTIADKFARSDDFASRIDGVCLPDEAWAVFAQLEQPANAEDLARQVEQPVDAVLASLTALVQHGLIRKQLRNWREFLAQKGGAKSPDAAPVTVPVAEARAAGRPGAALAGWPKPSAPHVDATETSAPLTAGPGIASGPLTPPRIDGPDTRSDPTARNEPLLFSDFPPPRVGAREVAPALARPAPVAAVPTPVVAPTSPRANPEAVLPVSFSIVNEKARIERRTTTAMTISFRLSAKAATAAVAWKLNPLLKAIVQKGGGGLPGQLLVYRVFIHVPAQMMHAAGIQSLSLVDDSVMIRDRAFYDALCQAAHAVASLDLRTIKV